MKKPLTPSEATERLEVLCARAEQSTADMRRKLALWGISSSVANEIIDSLTARGFIDDLRFARAYVRDKYRFSAWGTAKIRAGLYAKRISASDIDEALHEIDARQYASIAFSAISTRLRTIDRTDLHSCRQKLLRFGLSRGYETSLILRILNSRSLWKD